MRKRIVDSRGRVSVPPPVYHIAKEWGESLLKEMERDGVDRSDQLVVLQELNDELMFYWRFQLDGQFNPVASQS